MQEGTIAVSQREVKRYGLLRRALEGKLTLVRATQGLGVSYRQAKRLKRKVKEEGLKGLAHGNRGRSPANKLEEGLRRRVLGLSEERYRDFNDTHFSEELAKREGIALSRETLRRWRREGGIKPKRKRRAPRHRSRRPRKPAEGLMMLWDGSPHQWFGKEAKACCLMAAMDDATGKVLALLFLPQESSWGYLKLLEQVVTRWGIPGSVYQDCHGALKRHDDCWSLEEELAGKREPTQVGRALEALEIEPIFAGSAQAKGRIERLFGTLQDRLVVLLAREGITELAAANAYVNNGFLAEFNSKFAEAPQSSERVWRTPPRPAERERILSLGYTATVGNDNAVRLEGRVIDIPPGPGKRSYAKLRVEVRQVLDGSWRVYWGDQLLASAPASEIADLIRTRRRRKGMRAAYDYQWVNLASKPGPALPGVPPADTLVGTPPVNLPRQAHPEHDAPGRADPPTTRLRRANPGRRIGATRIA